jgi:flagellar protein FliS
MYRANVSRYQQNQVMLSSPGEILLALYDGAIRFSRQARIAIENRDPAVKGEKIGSVMAILAELTATLDHKQAPDLCKQLEMLYDYLLERLQEASMNMAIEPLDEVIVHLEKLRETWGEAVRITENEAKVTAADA